MKPHNDIQELLDRYWEGETTLEEERRLRQFFEAGQVPEQFRQDAAWFLALRAEQAVELPEKKVTPITRGVYRFRWAAAASVALLLTAGAGWWWMSRTSPAGMPPAPVAAKEQPKAPEQSPAPLVETAAPLVDVPPQTKIASTKQVKKVRVKKLRVRPPGTPLQPQAPELEQNDTEHAVAEIKAALELISSKLNKGKKELGKGLHEVETLDKIIRKKSDG